jgi:hypothetical protein
MDYSKFLIEAIRLDSNSIELQEQYVSGPDYVFQPNDSMRERDVAYMFIRSENDDGNRLFDNVELTLEENNYPLVIPWDVNFALWQSFVRDKESSNVFRSISKNKYPTGKGVMIALPWTLTYSHSHFFSLIIKGIRNPSVISIYTTNTAFQKQESVFLVRELSPLKGDRNPTRFDHRLAFEGYRLRVTSALIVTDADSIDEITLILNTGETQDYLVKLKAGEVYGSTKIFPLISGSNVLDYMEKYPNFARVINTTVVVEGIDDTKRVFGIEHNRITSCGKNVVLRISC